jgi:hypothetical protein
MLKLDWIWDIIQLAVRERKTGKIVINLYQGNVPTINVEECVKNPSA